MSNRKCYFFLILLNYPQPFSFEQIDKEVAQTVRLKSLWLAGSYVIFSEGLDLVCYLYLLERLLPATIADCKF